MSDQAHLSLQIRSVTFGELDLGDADEYGELEDELKTEEDPLYSSLLGHKSGPTPQSQRERRSSIADKIAKARRGPVAVAVSVLVLALVVVATSVGFYLSSRTNPPEPSPQHSALSSACAENSWRPGLYINCTLAMGLNNLRSELSQCLKFAFDAGAGIVPPLIVLRDQATLNAWSFGGGETDTYAHPSRYFDFEALTDSLEVSCPQMAIWSENVVGDMGRTANQIDEPRVVVNTRPGEWALHFAAGEYRTHVDALLEQAGVGSWEPEDPVVIREPVRPYAMWNYRSQPADLTHAFFDLIDFAPRLRDLGNAVASHPLLQHGFIGVHLRLEKDVIATWAGFDNQTSAYASYINPRAERVIFLACGDSSFKEPFAALFPSHTVVDKWDLLPPGSDSREKAEELNFDEMAVLDYLPMRSASLVLGIGLSSFAYLLGVDRREPKESYFSDHLNLTLYPAGTKMVGDERTLLLPPILPEYYIYFP